MDFDEIPDDIWIEIFERVDEPNPLAVLMRTCQRFRRLARRPLLREIKWMKAGSTRRNIDAWNGVYQSAHIFPRKMTIGVPFEFTSRFFGGYTTITNETRLHDSIWAHLPLFTNLNELVLDGTTISLYSYTIFAQIPALRSLELLNCTFIRLPSSFQQQSELDKRHRPAAFPASFPFPTLPLTHLSIHKLNGQIDSDAFHPINLVAAANLASLSITWTGSIAHAYASTTPHLPNLAELDVTMPMLTRDLVDSLLAFLSACPSAPPPNTHLLIERHNLSDQQIVAITVPLRNVSVYEGPLPIASFGMTKQQIRQQNANRGLRSVVMNEPLDVGGVLDGMERLPSGLARLEVLVRRWDVEMLFAIRELFPDIERLVIRYGRGQFPPDFFVTLGANILFDLPKLVTLKVYHDTSCIFHPSSTRQMNGAAQNYFGSFAPFFTNVNAGGGGGGGVVGGGGGGGGGGGAGAGAGAGAGGGMYGWNDHDNNSEGSSSSDEGGSGGGGGLWAGPSRSLSGGGSGSGSGGGGGGGGSNNNNTGCEQADLRDYLIGWNRYCKKLRYVQLSEDTWWERRFEGDVWREVSVGEAGN